MLKIHHDYGMDIFKKSKIWKNLAKSEIFGDTFKIRYNLDYRIIIHNPQKVTSGHPCPAGVI